MIACEVVNELSIQGSNIGMRLITVAGCVNLSRTLCRDLLFYVISGPNTTKRHKTIKPTIHSKDVWKRGQMRSSRSRQQAHRLNVVAIDFPFRSPP